MSEKLIRDPEFERFVPPLTPKERELLEESILSEGCRDAIIVWNNIILDGYNRYDKCRKHKAVNLSFSCVFLCVLMCSSV